METLETAVFSTYRNGEFLQFAKNGIKILKDYDLVGLSLDQRGNIYSKAVDKMDVVFQPILSSELTPDLSLLDTRRDNCIMGIRTFLDSQEYREEPEIVAAAKLLKSNMASRADRIDKLSYQQETAVTSSLVKDWGEGSLKDAVVLLQLTAWVGLLGDINTKFDTIYVERAKNAPQPADIENKRAEIINAYEELTKDVVAYSRIAADKEPYLKIIRQFNGLIKDYNDAAAQRLATRSTDEDGTPNTDTPQA